jgi:hypothetical protein
VNSCLSFAVMHQGDKIVSSPPSSKPSSSTMDSSAATALLARLCPPQRSCTSPSLRTTTQSARP